MLFRCIVMLSFCSALLIPQSAFAVDGSVLWLPKKYKDLKPRLMQVALQAQAMERCKVVVAGEMITSKNTNDQYYFVITCRDANSRSYNLSYLVPKSGTASELLAEQRSLLSAQGEGDVVFGKEGLTREKALELCAQSLQGMEILSGATQLLIDAIEEQEAGETLAFNLMYPFTASNRHGDLVRFDASCQVGHKGEVNVSWGGMHREQALEFCYEGLEDEAILIGKIDINYTEVTDRDHDEAYVHRFRLPFTSENREGKTIRYNGDCFVDSEGDTDVDTRIDIDSIVKLCSDALLKQATLMIDIEILEEEIEPTREDEYSFYSNIPFDANDPSGRRLHYFAHCVVDDAGHSEIEIKGRGR